MTTRSGSPEPGPARRPGDIDSVEAGHPDVDEADVGAQPPGQRDGLGAVGGLRDHGDVRLVFEDEAKSIADHRLIVGDQHPDGHRLRGVGSVASTDQPARSGDRR